MRLGKLEVGSFKKSLSYGRDAGDATSDLILTRLSYQIYMYTAFCAVIYFH